MTPTVQLVLGLVVLTAGAESLVRGASRIAAGIGVPPLIVGLTVVSFGTSAPELAVSVKAGLAGQADIALGNVIGSNLFNVLVILGLSAVITPLVVDRQLIRRDVPVMIGLAGLTWALAFDGALTRIDGVVLCVGLLGYMGHLAWGATRRSTSPAAQDAPPAPLRRAWSAMVLAVAFVAAGMTMLVLGSRWFVAGAVELALALGISELVVGLTLVAGGTSLPELATSVVAALRGQRDIAVGNVVGSNIFNVVCVLGIATVVAPDPVQVSAEVVRFDLVVMFAVSVACLPVFFSGAIVSRREGLFLVGYYGIYSVMIVLRALERPEFSTLQVAVWGFLIPMTGLAMVLSSARRGSRGRGGP